MANKTVQALKIAASVVLEKEARGTLSKALMAKTPAAPAVLVSARVKVSHAIAARYDDPAHSARITDRIAEIKATLGKLGSIENWNVVAGAVPVDDAEVLPDLATAAE